MPLGMGPMIAAYAGMQNDPTSLIETLLSGQNSPVSEDNGSFGGMDLAKLVELLSPVAAQLPEDFNRRTRWDALGQFGAGMLSAPLGQFGQGLGAGLQNYYRTMEGAKERERDFLQRQAESQSSGNYRIVSALADLVRANKYGEQDKKRDYSQYLKYVAQMGPERLQEFTGAIAAGDYDRIRQILNDIQDELNYPRDLERTKELKKWEYGNRPPEAPSVIYGAEGALLLDKRSGGPAKPIPQEGGGNVGYRPRESERQEDPGVIAKSLLSDSKQRDALVGAIIVNKLPPDQMEDIQMEYKYGGAKDDPSFGMNLAIEYYSSVYGRKVTPHEAMILLVRDAMDMGALNQQTTLSNKEVEEGL